MATPYAQAALELEVLVARAARRGVLELEAVLEAYVALAPGNHPDLGNPRRLDLLALVAALQTLPLDFFLAPRLLLVPRLEAFTHAPVPAAGQRAGRLPDGSVLIEAPHGLLSVLDIVASLCVVAHEQEKAWLRLAPRSAADDAAGEAPPTSHAQLAFDLGHDERALRAALRATDGALLRVLEASTPLPEITLHVDLSPACVGARADAQADTVVATLAEMGLAHRPLHLWFGDPIVTDCVSPYVRELRRVLWQWAGENAAELSPDLQALPADAGEDFFYALVNDFMAADPRLYAERVAADRTVGILHHAPHAEPDGDWGPEPCGFEVVDFGRLAPGLCDARLPAWQQTAPHPVLVRLPTHGTAYDAQLMARLLDTLAPTLASVTLVTAGTTLHGGPGALALPRRLVAWGGAMTTPLPPSYLTPADFVGLIDAPVAEGAVISLPSASLTAPAALLAQAQAVGGTCFQVGHGAVHAVLADAVWRARLPLDVDIAWVVVNSENVPNGRPSVQSLGGYAAAALARLRAITAPRLPASAPQAPPSRPKSAARTVRLKA